MEEVQQFEIGPESFTELVKRHQAMVFGIAVHSLRNGAAAEDISQDVFLELYRNLDRIENEKHLTYWLRQVTSRKCIDYIRWRRLRPFHTLEDVSEPVAAEKAADPLASRQLRQLVATLPARMRLAVILRYQEEMAASFGSTSGAVRSLVHRGLEMLREKMSRKGLTEAKMRQAGAME